MRTKLLPAIEAAAFKGFFFFFILLSIKSLAQEFDGEMEVRNYLRQNLSLPENVIQTVHVTKAYEDPASGIKHIYANQKINGLTRYKG